MPTNFPNGPDVFTNKTPHVSVNAAADVNNLQDAVLALETALLSAPNPNGLDYVSKSRADTVTGVKSGDWQQWGHGQFSITSASNPTPALGDFVADDTAAIQAAIDAAFNAGGGVVLVPPVATNKGYIFTQLKMRTKVWLRGFGPQSLLWSKNSNPNAYCIILNSATETDVVLSDMQIHGNKTNQTANGCLLFDHTGQSGDMRHRLYNLYIQNFKNDGIHFTGAARSMFLAGHYILSCDGNGMVFDANATDNRITDCVVGKSGLNGYVNSGANNHYTQCDSFQSGQVDAVTNGDGFQFLAANVSQGKGLSAQANLRHGFLFSGSNYHDMVGMTADSNGGDAFKLDNCRYSYITGNATHANGAGVGHTSIANVINGGINCKLEVVYEPAALKSGNVAVQGTALATNDVWINTTLVAWSRERNYRVNALGEIAESSPVNGASNNGIPTSQRLTATAFYFFAGQVVTGVTLPFLVGAAGLTLAQSCLYAQSNSALLANSSDQSATLNGAGTGKFNMAFSAPFTILTTGLYYAGFLFVGTTPPSIARNQSGGPANLAARPGGSPVPVVFQSGQATLPAPATFSPGQNGDAYCFEVY